MSPTGVCSNSMHSLVVVAWDIAASLLSVVTACAGIITRFTTGLVHTSGKALTDRAAPATTGMALSSLRLCGSVIVITPAGITTG